MTSSNARGRRKRLRYYRHADCHICGLPIPPDIVDNKHPLFGTIDHIQPLSREGKDVADNRAPSHRCCNNHRGNKDITEDLREVCAHLALAAFHSFCIPQTKRFKTVRGLIKTLVNNKGKLRILVNI